MASVNSRSTARQRRRVRLFYDQKGLCHWCKKQMSLQKQHPPRPDYATFEHLLPRSMGGKSGYHNVVLACHSCNARRGNSPYFEPPRTWTTDSTAPMVGEYYADYSPVRRATEPT